MADSTAEKLLASLADSGDINFMLAHPEIERYMAPAPVDAVLYDIVDKHVRTYGKIPSRSTLEELWGQALPGVTEPPGYYLDLLRPLYIKKTLQVAGIAAQECIGVDPEKAFQILRKAVAEVENIQTGLSVMDFREAGPRLMKHLSSKWAGNSIPFGWPTMDKMSSGLMAGDFISVAGWTGIGKTYLLLSRALYFWETLGLPVLFISGEMNLDAILERGASMHGHIPFDFLKHGMLPNIGKTNWKQKLVDAMQAASTKKNGLYFVDANLAATNQDVGRLCNQLHPTVMLYDGAYLGGSPSYDKRWQQIAEGATFMKKEICQKMGIPVIASYQLTKESKKEFKKTKSAPDSSDIAGSAEIGRLSSMSLMMTDGDTPETILQRKVTVAKGRSGEVGHFYISNDFMKMDFEEVIEEKAELDIK